MLLHRLAKSLVNKGLYKMTFSNGVDEPKHLKYAVAVCPDYY
jgi:hypothetical protein